MQYTGRDAILDAFQRLEKKTGRTAFRVREILDEVKREHPGYQDSTIQTYVVSVMCENAPVHHANHTNDLRRVDRGLYQRVARAGNDPGTPPPRRTRSAPRPMEPDSGEAMEEWHWEGNVQATLVSRLAGDGWAIKSVANTAVREHGVDILADKGGHRLAVEVKGYPSLYYVRGPKKGERKKTAPPMQARVWFADLLMSTMLLLDSEEYDSVAMCLPAVGTYTSLIDRTKQSLARLGVIVVLVKEDAEIEIVIGTL